MLGDPQITYTLAISGQRNFCATSFWLNHKLRNSLAGDTATRSDILAFTVEKERVICSKVKNTHNNPNSI